MSTRRGTAWRALAAGIVGAAAIIGAALSVAGGGGCTVPDLDASGKKCASRADCANGQMCTEAGACMNPEEDAGNLCNGIPRFAGSQVVDGKNDDFASVQVFHYDSSHLANLDQATMPEMIDIDAQVGWSAEGLHLFFHVTYAADAAVELPTDDDPLWYGDSIELFAKSDDHLTGNYGGGVDPGALHIIGVPDDTTPPRSQMDVSYGMDVLGPLFDGGVASRRDGTGYALEFFVPWPLVSPVPEAGTTVPVPEAGAAVGFDFSIDMRSRTHDDRQYQVSLKLGSVTDTSKCAGGAFPTCDDQTWCTPILSP